MYAISYCDPISGSVRSYAIRVGELALLLKRTATQLTDEHGHPLFGSQCGPPLMLSRTATQLAGL